MTLYMGLQKITPAILSNESVSKKYSLLQRIRDDSYNEIGTVSGFFTNSNNVEYAVVCLDAQYRLANGKVCSNTGSITNLPMYNDLITSNWRTSTETATFNTQKILDYCTANGYTSTACTHCHSKSFSIDGITYYGQFPNMAELNDIGTHIVDINNADTSASSYSSLNFSSSKTIWSSSQYNSSDGIFLGFSGGISHGTKTIDAFICPVLELPNVKTNYLKFTSKNENIVERCTYTTLYNGISVDANSSYGRASFVFPVSQDKTYVIEFDSSYVDGYHMVYFSDTALNSGDPWDPSYTSMSVGGHKTYTFTSTSDVLWIGIYASASTSSGNITLTNVTLTETQS